MARSRRLIATTALAGSAALILAACSPGSGGNSGNGSGNGDGESEASGTVVFRLWDEAAASAYEESFELFNEQNPDIEVDVEVVPWANYWERLPQDISSGTMADIFWTNTSNFGIYADNGDLLDLSEIVNENPGSLTDSVVELYTRDDVQWGVPQLWDSIALFYNVELLEEAGIDPSDLTWDPSGSNDTLREAALELTVDSDGNTANDPDFDPENIETFGFNAQADLQAIWLDFLAENGGQFQDENDQYTFSSPEGVGAFQYLVDLINTDHVAPSAADTNQNGDFSRDLFVQGRLALFQSGPYSLPPLADADFDWDIAPKVEGPQGRVSVVHGVSAVGNAHTGNEEATMEVLRWLATPEGQQPLGESGAAFPGAVDAQQSFVDYWADEDVDVSVFIEAAEGDTVSAPLGPRANAGALEMTPILQEMFAGRIPVEDALEQAQNAANEAIAD